MKRKSLVGLLLAASLASTTMSNPPEVKPKRPNIEQLLKESRIRRRELELSMQYPFMNESKLNYKVKGKYFIVSGEGPGSITSETELTDTGAITTFNLDARINHFLLTGALQEQSQVVFDKDKFTSTEYRYESSGSRKKDQRATNADLTKTVLDELSVIQYLRSLDLSNIGTDETLKFPAIGIGKTYDILVSRSDKITPVRTAPGIKYEDFWHMQVLLDKKPKPQHLTVYYTKDEQKLPIFVKLKIKGVECKLYLQDVER